MEQQQQHQHHQINKRINILMGVAGMAMIVGLAGLIIGLTRSATPSSPAGSMNGVTEKTIQPGGSYQEAIQSSPDRLPKEGSTSNN